MTTMTDHTMNLARAIKRAAREHGVPNSFPAGELEALYGGPPARFAGIIARSRQVNLAVCMDGMGFRVTGYEAGAFKVEAGSSWPMEPRK